MSFQKIHNALKWLIKKYGQNYGSMTIVVWDSSLNDVHNEMNGPIENAWDDDESYDSYETYKDWLRKYIYGYQRELDDTDNESKVMVLGLDSATTGRISIAMYEELQSSDFLRKIERWHDMTSWMRFDTKRKKNVFKSFSLYEIIRAAYGTEQNGKLECDEKLIQDQLMRLLPCMLDERPIPVDLIRSLHNKASNPAAYEQKYNHRLVVEATCGMYRMYKKGAIPMGYDPNMTDRSYLYGCLLAIADKAEYETYEPDDKAKRETNARRFWSNFSQRPYQTWRYIEERLRPYLKKHPYRVRVEKYIEEVMSKFSPEDFTNNTRLDTKYLLGYHQFMDYMYQYQGNNKEEE